MNIVYAKPDLQFPPLFPSSTMHMKSNSGLNFPLSSDPSQKLLTGQNLHHFQCYFYLLLEHKSVKALLRAEHLLDRQTTGRKKGILGISPWHESAFTS